MIPTLEEYKKAKEIVIAFENENARLETIKIENFRIDLKSLFLNNSKIIIEDFILRKEYNSYDIIPQKPCLEENYDGELNEEIEELCKKHGVKASIIYWCYHK